MHFQSSFAFLILSISILAQSQSLTLVDYAKPNAVFNIVEDTKTEAPQKNQFVWNRSYIGLKKEIDASSFDSLIISLVNPQSNAINLNLEIKDTESKDYWSRVNYYVSVAPGASEIRIPLKLRVGDNSRPGRPLNTAKITSIILARADNAERSVQLIVKSMIVKKEISIVPEGIYAFDFGGDETPVFPGFAAVTAQTKYTKEQSYGLIDAEIWQPYPHANDALQPDSLYRDALFIPRGTFQVDVPNGEYESILNLDFASGYWGEFPLFKKRIVFAQEREVIRLTLDRNQAADRYFQFAEISDHSGDSFFEKYYDPIFKEHRFLTTVKNGQLKLRFEGDNCAENACFGMAVNSLILIPKNLKKQGDDFLVKLKTARSLEFSQKFTFLPPASHSIKAAEVKELTYFAWPVGMEMPEKLSADLIKQKDLSVTMLKGQRTSLSFGVIGPEPTILQMIKIKPRLGEPSLKTWPVARRMTRTLPASHIFTVAERYLLEKNIVQLRKDESSRIWIEIDSENTAAGQYNQIISISHKNKEIKIPISIKVLDLVLPAVDFPVGPFNSSIQEAWWFENPYREDLLQKKSFEKMQETGLTTASFFARLDIDWEKRPLDIRNIDRITRFMQMAQMHGFLSLTAYNSVLAYQDLCRGQFSDNDLKRMADRLNQESVKQKWLPLNIVICDEPVGEELPGALRRTRLLQSFNTPKVQFGTAFSYDGKDEEFKTLYNDSKLPFLGLFSYEKLVTDQKKWYFYNSANRASFGFGLFKLRETTNLQGRIAWNWNQNAGNPYFPLDAREDDVNWCNSLRSGDLQCAVFFKRHILEGLNDYRLARLLQKTKFANLVLQKEANQLLKEIKANANVSTEVSPGDEKNYYVNEDRWRNQIFSLFSRMLDDTSVKAKSK